MFGRIWKALLAAASIRFWIMAGAAMALTFFAAWLVWIVWRGGWPAAQAGRQLDILGRALWIVLAAAWAIVAVLAGKRIEVRGVLGSLDVGGDAPERERER